MIRLAVCNIYIHTMYSNNQANSNSWYRDSTRWIAIFSVGSRLAALFDSCVRLVLAIREAFLPVVQFALCINRYDKTREDQLRF
jgi:hypothetical protein